MKLKTLLLLAALVLPATAQEWQTSWDKAAAESKKTGHPILMDFTGSDWCIWCKRLKAEVFETSEFKEWAKKNVVLLEVDFPSNKPVPAGNKELSEKYEIEGYPTIIFADANGKKLGQCGYEKGGPKGWLPVAEKALKGE